MSDFQGLMMEPKCLSASVSAGRTRAGRPENSGSLEKIWPLMEPLCFRLASGFAVTLRHSTPALPAPPATTHADVIV
ncbi:hypothetical protein EVAR_103249_1 [Eumeta japonica]|uniref:Uncharacterized protein n=1 Tax=Eumeta variegata TaxID=151549 RepID=A0A4C2A2V6_EUMVA|nr:hypothetical protein EVAR_103249_1 [Eumeta japonica]